MPAFFFFFLCVCEKDHAKGQKKDELCSPFAAFLCFCPQGLNTPFLSFFGVFGPFLGSFPFLESVVCVCSITDTADCVCFALLHDSLPSLLRSCQRVYIRHWRFLANALSPLLAPLSSPLFLVHILVSCRCVLLLILYDALFRRWSTNVCVCACEPPSFNPLFSSPYSVSNLQR